MPTYGYECKKCTHTFELFQSMSDTPADTCPDCGGEVRRLIAGGLGVIFKGSGFYITDSRKDGNGSRNSDTGSREKRSGDENSSRESSGKEASAESASKEGKPGNGSSGEEKSSACCGAHETCEKSKKSKEPVKV